MSRLQLEGKKLTENIVISGDTLTGKTMVAIALAAKLKEKGKSVGYFKPVGTKSYDYSTPTDDIDEDAAIMKELLEMKPSLSCICPIVRTGSSYDELLRVGHDKLLERIKNCYHEISEGFDYMIIEGTKASWHLMHVDLSTPQLAKEFDASVICLVNFPDITAIDDILLQIELFKQHGVEKVSIVLNMVSPMLKKTVAEQIGPFLAERGIDLVGVIYLNRELFSPTIREIKKALDGQMIGDTDKMDLLIDQFMVGSMAPENALKWFRRVTDKAVITSGDRADICLTALETDTNLLILTGGMGPDIGTVARAREKGVPIMMTAHDTYQTGHIVDELIGTVTADNKEKLKIVENIVGSVLDLKAILE
ncbi:MAG: DRTGG domain-containing protein [Candidatus Thorarchaeota archaeon]